MTIFLVLLIVWFVRGRSRFEEVKRLTSLIIPVFSILMFLINFKPSHQNFIMLLVIAVVSAAISFFQAHFTQVKVDPELDKYGRKKAQIKGGWPYLLGWVAIFIVELILIWIRTGELEIWKTLSSDLLLEIFEVSRFSSNESEWFIWALAGFTAYFYSVWLRLFHPSIKNALQRRKKD